MAIPTILVSSWSDGVLALVGEARDQELARQSVRSLASDGRGGALAIVDGHELRRRTPDGRWETLATSEADLACAIAVGDAIYIGTDDARLLRLEANGELVPLPGFDAAPGREKWYAGQALIDGRLVSSNAKGCTHRIAPPLPSRARTCSSPRPTATSLRKARARGIATPSGVLIL